MWFIIWSSQSSVPGCLVGSCNGFVDVLSKTLAAFKNNEGDVWEEKGGRFAAPSSQQPAVAQESGGGQQQQDENQHHCPNKSIVTGRCCGTAATLWCGPALIYTAFLGGSAVLSPVCVLKLYVLWVFFPFPG